MSFSYFSLAELRALPDLSGNTYPDTQLTGAADWIEALVERICQTSFVPRARTDTLSGLDQSPRMKLVLPAGWTLSITAVTENSLTVSPADVFCSPQGVLERIPSGATSAIPWAWGRRNIVVSSTAGYSTTPPADLKYAMLAAARAHIIGFRSQSGVPDRALSIQNDFGNVSLATPGDRFPTGLPWADAVINGWADQTGALERP